MTCSGITGRGRGKVPPRNFSMGNFCWPTGKKGARKKGKKGVRKWKGGGKEAKLEREEVENWKCKGIGMKMSRSPPFFFFCLSLFETTQICSGSTKMDKFARKNHISHREKNQENWLCPLWKIFFLHPWWRESEDINRKRLFPKIKLIPISHIQVTLDYVYSVGITSQATVLN